MAKIKLTKTAVDAAQPQAQAVELRDTVVPGFLCKITPAGRKVFMLQYRTNTGERRKPALGLFGELTVEQARVMAQDWLAEVRRGGDEVPPVISASGNLVKSVFEKENGLEEAVFRRADHRFFAAGGSRRGDQGTVSATWFQ